MSAKTKSERFRRLISHGYFAPELPPCFVSDDLARNRASIIKSIKKLPNSKRGDPACFGFISEIATFYFPRYGKEDRRHGVPNPISHMLLSEVIADKYVDLRRRARSSKITLSPPVFDWSGPRALMRSSVESRDEFRLNLSSRREEYVEADIRAFFHSIYTHAIAWAVHGKKTAKKNRKLSSYGNQIDLLCRNAQGGQTIGLPVGPDTSRLIAEVVASAIDEHLQDRLSLGARDASRYVDDYTLSSPNGANGAVLLAEIRQSAGVFELELSSEKSGIYPTSHRHSAGWQQEVRASIPRPNTGAHRVEVTALQRFLYSIGRLCASHPEINIEKFGIQNARSAFINVDKWEPIQSYLINSYRRNTTLVSLLVEIFILRQGARRDVNVNVVKEFIEVRVPVLARENRTGEIIWLLFLAARLRIELSASKITPLFSLENPFIALFIVYLDNIGKIQGKVDRTIWDQSLTSDGLEGPMWLYAYEAVAQGYLTGVNNTFILQHQYFSLLRSKRIKFFDIDRGLNSLFSILRSLREENVRNRILQVALQEEDDDHGTEFDDIDFGDEVDSVDGTGDY